MNSERSKTGLYVLAAIAFIYLLVLFYDVGLFIETLLSARAVFKQIFYIFFIIYALMVLFDYLVNPRALKKHLGKDSGVKGWLIAIVSGIISTGPIYMWYPFLAELKKEGMKNSLVAAFLYNRAIKIPLIPIALAYFSLKYLIILNFVMIGISVIQGNIVEVLTRKEQK